MSAWGKGSSAKINQPLLHIHPQKWDQKKKKKSRKKGLRRGNFCCKTGFLNNIWGESFFFPSFFWGGGRLNIFNSILSFKWQIYPSKIMFHAQTLKGKWLRKCWKNAARHTWSPNWTAKRRKYSGNVKKGESKKRFNSSSRHGGLPRDSYRTILNLYFNIYRLATLLKLYIWKTACSLSGLDQSSFSSLALQMLNLFLLHFNRVFQATTSPLPLAIFKPGCYLNMQQLFFKIQALDV